MARGAVVASLRHEEASVDDLVRLQLGSEAVGPGLLPGTA